MKHLIVISMLCLSFSLHAQTVIDISVKGISDANNDGAQKDRKEAILDAKKQACDKAGVKLSSKTMVENFQTVYDYVESQAEAVLLPGFQVIDVGYVADGTYQVVLSGKLKTPADEPISGKEIRYARSLYLRGKFDQCSGILKRYIDTTDEKVSDETKEQAFYYFIRWGFPLHPRESFEMFASYYPESKRIATLKAFLAFAEKPLLTFDTTMTVKNSDWKKSSFQQDTVKYDMRIDACKDTFIVTDFANQKHSLILAYRMYRTGMKIREPFAYSYRLVYCKGDIRSDPPENKESYKEVFNTFKSFSGSSQKKYQASRSDVRFNNFKMADYRLEGQIPSEKGAFNQTMKFMIYQVAY